MGPDVLKEVRMLTGASAFESRFSLQSKGLTLICETFFYVLLFDGEGREVYPDEYREVLFLARRERFSRKCGAFIFLLVFQKFI